MLPIEIEMQLIVASIVETESIESNLDLDDSHKLLIENPPVDFLLANNDCSGKRPNIGGARLVFVFFVSSSG